MTVITATIHENLVNKLRGQLTLWYHTVYIVATLVPFMLEWQLKKKGNLVMLWLFYYSKNACCMHCIPVYKIMSGSTSRIVSKNRSNVESGRSQLYSPYFPASP